jgi:hypothetical protein
MTDSEFVNQLTSIVDEPRLALREDDPSARELRHSLDRSKTALASCTEPGLQPSTANATIDDINCTVSVVMRTSIP